MVIKIRDDRPMRALTGLGFAEFDQLLPVSTAVYEAQQQRRYEQALQAGTRRRQLCPEGPGGARANYRRWPINCSLSCTITKPIRPLIN